MNTATTAASAKPTIVLNYRQNDRQRGSASKRGYDKQHHDRFRTPVLERAGYKCQGPDGCDARATDADHYPTSRRELVKAGLDANDPQYGRALCHAHHSSHTGGLRNVEG